MTHKIDHISAVWQWCNFPRIEALHFRVIIYAYLKAEEYSTVDIIAGNGSLKTFKIMIFKCILCLVSTLVIRLMWQTRWDKLVLSSYPSQKWNLNWRRCRKNCTKSVPFFSTRYKVGCCLGLGTWQMILYAATICHNLKNCRTKVHPWPFLNTWKLVLK